MAAYEAYPAWKLANHALPEDGIERPADIGWLPKAEQYPR